jgi:His-Xaa-Ser system radical SAM maturase HxsB
VSKFKAASAYQADSASPYTLLPFNFLKASNQKYRAVTLAGAYAELDLTELEALVDGDLVPGSDLYLNLRSKGFFFDALSRNNIALTSIRLRTKMAHVFHLTSLHMFVISLRCDHSCPYCQVSRQNIDSNNIFDMTESTANKALDVVFESPSKYIKIEFQGGEPLLNLDLLKYIVLRAHKLNETHKRDLDFIIATNLAMINEEILAFCKQFGVSISTSLDGPKMLHNGNRPRPGRDSYEKTIEGIGLCRDYLGRDKVSALMTTSPNSLSQFREIVDEYLAQGFEGVFLRPLSPYGYAVKTKWAESYSIEEWLEEYKKVLYYILEINKAGHPFVEFYTALVAKRILKPSYTGYVDLQHPTGAGFSALLYNYDGKVYSSDEGRMLAEMGDKSLCLGDLKQDSFSDLISSESLKAQVDESFGYTSSSCEQCAYLPYCGSEPTRHHVLQGEFKGNKIYSPFCKRQMGVIGHVFELLDNDDYKSILESWAYDCA